MPDADPTVALIPSGNPLEQQTSSLLEREEARLRALIGVDVQNSKRFSILSDRITKAESALNKILEQIDHVKGADERIRNLIEARRTAYAAVFEAIVEEEQELRALYAPIRQRIDTTKGTVSKLSFSVRREVDLDAWASAGEALLDLRTNGPFKGRGELVRAARKNLLPACSTGNASEA